MRLLEPAAALALALAACGVSAQLAADNPDWQEAPVPPPPAFSPHKLIALDASPSSTLSFGIDPATLAIAKEGVVRYVVVASSRSGAVNAMYEGIRCATGEVKVYARFNPGSGWNAVSDPAWKSLYAPSPSRHSLSIARGGVCKGNAPNQSVEHILRDLRASPDRKFE